MCKKLEIYKENSGFEQGILAELIYQTSDISQLAKWPLRLLAVICMLWSAIIWELKYDWYWFLNNKDVAFLGSFSQFTEIASIVLKAGTFISFTVAIISLAVFIFSFFKGNISKMMREALEVLISNSFFLGISLVFILFSVSDMRQATIQILLTTTRKIECSNNLEKLGKALLFYAKQNHHHYPPADKWCDELIKNTSVKESYFLCPGAATGNCHYALNPNAVPISRCKNINSYLDSYGLGPIGTWKIEDSKELRKTIEFWLRRHLTDCSGKKIDEISNIVLLFETDGGWNKFGGLELLTAEHHNNEGANILFNNGAVKFIKLDQFEELKWKIKEDKSGRESFSE